LASMVKDCNELLFMAVTAGSKIIESIHELEKDDLTRSVVYDATASEMVDACFDWIQKYIRQELRRESRQLLPKRISCGYGDFSLQNQKVFFKLMRLDTMGITITKSFMLVPEKSATAVTGIRKNQ
jgi:cobalamin-dependent methionine synthase I